MSARSLVAVLLLVVAARGVLGARGARRVRVRLPGPRPGRAVSGGVAALARWLAPRFEAADLPWAPATGARAGLLVLGLGVPSVALVVGPVPGLLLAVGVAAAPPVLGAVLGDRRDRRLERELPELLEAVARSLRTGAALPIALREASSAPSLAARELGGVLGATDDGVALVDALASWARRRPMAAVRLVVGALAVALQVGGAPARAVDGVAATLRERREIDREVRAMATQARASAAVVTLAPVAFGLLGALGDERTATFLLATPTGLACLVTGLALDGLGAWWMTHLTRSPT